MSKPEEMNPSDFHLADFFVIESDKLTIDD